MTYQTKAFVVLYVFEPDPIERITVGKTTGPA